MKNANHKVLIPGIVGPTAVGKTGVAVRIAKQQGWEIVSADSRQIYKQLDIGTAKPTREERSQVAHHLIDVVQPWESYSCGRYKREATATIEAILSKGKVPLIVGGSGLYLRALGRGLFEGPEKDESLRSELRSVADQQGRKSLHERLARVDPISASRIHPSDVERVIRAIEVFNITGKPISELQRTPTGPGPFALWLAGLRRPRELLYRLIDERFDRMLEEGFVEEVRGLLDRGFSESWPSFRTVGYREMVKYLRGVLPYQTAREKAKTETRRFAKRQHTWFAKARVAVWLDVPEQEGLNRTTERVLETLKRAGVSSKVGQ